MNTLILDKVVSIILIFLKILIFILQLYLGHFYQIMFPISPVQIPRARSPPVLVPAIQSKHSLMGFPTSFSIAINIRHRTIPLIPPPSKDKSCKDIEINHTNNNTFHIQYKSKCILFSNQKSGEATYKV